MNPTETLVTPPDYAGSYARRIEEHLEQQPAGTFLTVPELIDVLKHAERRIREGLDRLAYERKIQVRTRHTPGRRGTMPREYALVSMAAAQPLPTTAQ